METIDSSKITILTALESAAFETREHATLLHRLEHTFSLFGFVISWIRSYLTNRSSFVKIDSSSSPFTTISTGVPPGSVLSPLLFVLFISPDRGVMQWRLWRLKPALKILVNNFLFKVIIMKI